MLIRLMKKMPQLRNLLIIYSLIELIACATVPKAQIQACISDAATQTMRCYDEKTGVLKVVSWASSDKMTCFAPDDLAVLLQQLHTTVVSP